MISAISWVPKGAAKPQPIFADPPSKEAIDNIKAKAGLLDTQEGDENDNDNADFSENDVGNADVDEEEMDLDASKPRDEIDEIAQALAAADALGSGIIKGMEELDMDNYDNEDDGVELFGEGIRSLYYPDNKMDPYLQGNDEDSEEEEDMTINPEDALIVCARNEDDVSHLEVWIVEGSEGADSNSYVHHDIIIPAFPLCLAWMDCPLNGGEKGNFIAVGSMEPTIEIWDLDIMDEVQPSAVLGGIIEKKKKKKGGKKKKSVIFKEGSHTDSVLGLAWNKEYRNVLASASADKLVKVWDVVTGNCSYTLDHHTDKVQAVAWNPFAPQVLLSGSFDHSVIMKDARSPSHAGFKWSVAADVESLAWDPHAEHSFAVSLENGMVTCFDIRTSSSNRSSDPKPSFTLHAHDKAVSSISYNQLVPNLLATGSMDKTVKLWDLSNNQPSCVSSKNLKAGAVFSVSFSDDCPFLLAVGGSKGKLELWKTLSEDAVLTRYGKFANQKPRET
ncbi:OLC1v1007304C1 [Oldenlandia corymbosa var. corymbosa]|uniref:OLC1v1007304C1 n=1 Tax=Oldenlandia corymbosa var. corymbosa TaxID=529605 RepID=A0AAV1DIZ1_OLDCO|nr:OLC1v1007304C1 [Oldenlandia corymbosa var. corymbosa]